MARSPTASAPYLVMVRPPFHPAWGWSAFIYHRPAWDAEAQLVGFTSHCSLETLLRKLTRTRPDISLHIMESGPANKLSASPYELVDLVPWEPVR
jgi:hypothetical protein